MSSELLQPFWGHVEDLRKLILRCFLVILLSALISFFFSHKAIHIMEMAIPDKPYKAIDIQPIDFEKISNRSELISTVAVPKHAEIRAHSSGVEMLPNGLYLLPPDSFIEISKPRERSLSLLSPIEGFTTSLKVAFWLGMLLAAPIWVFLIAQFIKPGLQPLEKKRVLPIIFSVLLLISLGLLTAFYFTLPLTNAYFSAFNQSLGVNVWSLSHYVDYVLTILLGHGIAFAAASILFLAIFFNWLSAKTLASYRRHVVIAILIASAILTPPDVLSQVLLSVPLLLLFEGALLYGRFIERKEAFRLTE